MSRLEGEHCLHQLCLLLIPIPVTPSLPTAVCWLLTPFPPLPAGDRDDRAQGPHRARRAGPLPPRAARQGEGVELDSLNVREKDAFMRGRSWWQSSRTLPPRGSVCTHPWCACLGRGRRAADPSLRFRSKAQVQTQIQIQGSDPDSDPRLRFRSKAQIQVVPCLRTFLTKVTSRSWWTA